MEITKATLDTKSSARLQESALRPRTIRHNFSSRKTVRFNLDDACKWQPDLMENKHPSALALSALARTQSPLYRCRRTGPFFRAFPFAGSELASLKCLLGEGTSADAANRLLRVDAIFVCAELVSARTCTTERSEQKWACPRRRAASSACTIVIVSQHLHFAHINCSQGKL